MHEVEYTAKSGVKVYAVQNSVQHGFFISLFLRDGSMYELAEEAGIIHFLEHILIRNVRRLTDEKLPMLLDKHGLELNASTYAEMVQFYITGARQNFSVAADIITQLLSPIVLSRADVDTERRRIKAEIRESDEQSSLSTFSSNIVYGGTSLSRAIIGTHRTVDRITLSRLEAKRRRSFCRENVFFYVSGGFSEADIQTLISFIDRFELESGVPNDNVAPVCDGFGKRCGSEVHVRNADFTMARFTFDVDMSCVSSQTLDLLYDALLTGYNSPIFMQMSEMRGIIYDISGSLERYKNIAELAFSFEIRERELYSALELTVDILRTLRTRTLSPDECMSAGYTDNAYMLCEDNREFNFTYAYDSHIMELGYKSVEDRIRAYSAVTPEHIRSAADNVFRLRNLTLALKANKKRIDTGRISEILARLEE